LTGNREVRIRPTRRAFLAGAAGALASCSAPISSGIPVARSAATAARTASPNVAIVGAGVAGLTCAYRLQQAGIPARIFEASNRIGGRTWTLRDYFAEGQIAEHGAEFISRGQRDVQHLAHELGLQLVNVNRYEAGHDTYFFDDAVYPIAQAREEYFSQVRGALRDAFRSAGYPTTFQRSTPAGRALDHTSAAEWIEQNVPGGLRSKLGALLSNGCVGEYGADPSRQSALNLIYLLAFEKNRHFNVDGTDEALHVVGGIDQIAGRMAAALPAGTIELRAPLVALRERADGSTLCTFEANGGRKEFAAQYVCLAIPFTTLRAVDLRQVSLSHLKRLAIDRLELGTNAKLNLQFRRRVWDDEKLDGSSYVQFPYEESWDVSAAQSGDYGILVGFPGGHAGVLPAAAHGPAPAPIAKAYVRQLDRIYPGLAAQYTGVAYLDVWAHDPWHHGAYSYYGVGQYTQFAGIEPVPEGNLFFAGEQTTYREMGYVNGAVISGERAAREIADRIGGGS
jgi:monoamine oxidase